MTDQPAEPTTTDHDDDEQPTLDSDQERDDTINVVHGDVTVTGQDNADDDDETTQESDAVDEPTEPTD